MPEQQEPPNPAKQGMCTQTSLAGLPFGVGFCSTRWRIFSTSMRTDTLTGRLFSGGEAELQRKAHPAKNLWIQDTEMVISPQSQQVAEIESSVKPITVRFIMRKSRFGASRGRGILKQVAAGAPISGLWR